MQTMIVCIDDADYAMRLLQPMLQTLPLLPLLPSLPSLPHANPIPTRWVLVGCAPRLSRHARKWVPRSAYLSWQQSWADAVFAQIKTQIHQQPRATDAVDTRLALSSQNLCELVETLTQQYGQSRVLDARRPKFGHELPPVTAGQKPEAKRLSGYASALAGAGLLAAFD